jgi:hypothetical protein
MTHLFWKGLMKVKDEFLIRASFNVGNGMDTRFWEDTWLGNKPLSQQYPSLYSIMQRNKFRLQMCSAITL